MNEVIQAASELQAVCELQKWQFCFIGGVAVLRWGQARETVDADLTLLTGFGGEEPFIDKLLAVFESRITDARQFAIDRRVLLLRSAKGVGLDVTLGALPFEELVVQRASKFLYPPNTQLRTCSAEDLIVMKAFAARGQDWVDIEHVIVRQTGQLDWKYVFEQLGPLVEIKGAPEILARLETLSDGPQQ